MLYVLFGEDDFSRQKFLEEIKRGIGDETVLAPNMCVLEGKQVTLDQLRGACETMPFLSPKRLVIIDGLLERFEPSRGKAGHKKKAGTPEPSKEYQTLADYLGKIPDFTVAVLTDGKINSRNPLLNELSKSKATVKSFPLLREAELRQYVRGQVSQQSGSISPQAVELLARFVGSNLWAMNNEIDKLVLYASKRRIEEEDVRQVATSAQEASVFAMADAILESRASVAQELLQKLIQDGAFPSYLLVMLVRQLRLLVQVKELAQQGISLADIQGRLGIPSDFVVKKAIEQAGKYSAARLVEVYHRLLEADVSIKTGNYNAELALDILVAELSQPKTDALK